MNQPVNLRIADRDYTVGCEPHEQESLIEAARLVDNRMREIRGSNRMASIDRVAVLAALNLAHELLQDRRADDGEQRDILLRLNDLSYKLDRLMQVVSR